VRCINNRRRCISLLMITIYGMLTLSGCGKNGLMMAYKDQYTIASTNAVSSKLEPFAAGLAVANEDIAGQMGASVEDQSAAGLFDVAHREVLYGKDIHAQMMPASLTKIMTALVALKYGNTEDVINCTAEVEDLEYDATKIGLVAGDQLTMNQALHALLISSANDAAIAIAIHVAGSQEDFVSLMNKEAKELGATNTNFANVHGLTADDHYTTVYDLYLITNAAMDYSLFNEIVHMDTYETVYNNGLGQEKKMSIKTTNLFLRGDYRAPERVTVIGGKTGTTLAAGNCLVLIVKDTSGNPYIGVILKASDRALLNEEMAKVLREIK